MLTSLHRETRRIEGAHDRAEHVTLEQTRMQDVVACLWERGVIPDFRSPRGLRAGLSPLSTSFTEVAVALAHVRQSLDAVPR